MGWCDDSGVSIRYQLAGGGPGTLVFIHELGGSLHSWEAVAEHFTAQWHCLRYDQRGAGGSEKVRQPYTVDDQVNDLCALLAKLALPAPYVLVSLAAGATVALAFARRDPAAVAALVLCTPATGVDVERRAYLEARAALAQEQGMRAIAVATLARSYPPEAMRDADVYRRYLARFLANDPVAYAHANRALVVFQLETVLDAITMPCLLVAGQHDLLRPWADVVALARRLPDAKVVSIDAGHLMAVQYPAALVAAMTDYFIERGLMPVSPAENEDEC